MDWQSVQPFFTWLSENPAWAGLAVLIIALTESLVIVGLIVPGAVLMFGVGTLVGTGVLGFKETILLAFIGAVLGDSISFWVGKNYHEQLARLWPLNKRPDYLELGRSFFTKHGGKSIFFGRFVGPVRPVIPAIAGMMGMSPRYFLAMNVLSASLWAPFYLIPGIVFGKSIALAEVVGGRLMVILLAAIVMLVLAVWLTRKLVLIALPRAESVFTIGFQWAVNHPQWGQIASFVFGSHITMRRALVVSGLLIILTLFAVYLLVLQLFHPSQLGIDEFAQNFAHLIQSPTLNGYFFPFNTLFSLPVIGLLLFVSAFSLFIVKEYSVLRYLLFSITASVVAGIILLLATATHTDQLATALYLVVLVSFAACLTIIIFSKFNFTIRWIAYTFFILVLLFPILSLFYFAQLQPSTVLMVIATSLVWVGFVSLIYHRELLLFNRQKIFGMLSLLALLVAGIIQVNLYEPFSSDAAERKEVNIPTTFNKWQTSGWEQLSSNRIDIFSEKKQALNIQWLGRLQDIEKSLREMGWEKPVDLSTQAIMYYLKPEPTFDELPLIPQSHNGKRESLVLYKRGENENQRYVLQLWKSSFRLIDSNSTLWLGALTHRTLSINEKWIRYPQIFIDDSIQTELFQPLDQAWNIKQMKRLSKQDVYLLSEKKNDEK